MKKFLMILLAVVLSFTVAGCNLTPGDKPDDDPIKPVEPTEDDGSFTVKLIYENQTFVTYEDITVIWTATDGSSMHTANFDTKTGVAKADGLDGIYYVTLSAPPSGYTYDPNDVTHRATNDSKSVEIELYKLIPLTKNGTNFYEDVIEMTTLGANDVGAYRLTFTKVGQQIHCQYKPAKNGVFVIESLVDINANEINPRLDVYVGNSSWKPQTPNDRIDGGGASSIFTKNFQYSISMTEQSKGSVYAFIVRCDSTIGMPVNIDFVIRRLGDHEIPPTVYTLQDIDPKVTLEQIPKQTGTFTYAWVMQENGRRLLDGSRFELGDDGYYHVKETGQLLYAKIAAPFEAGTFTLNFADSDDDLARINLRFGGKDYTFMLRGYEGMVKAGYFNQDILAQYENKLSYHDCVNKEDGVYPVTEQLANFLYAFASKEMYFHDGVGTLEHFQDDSGRSSGYDSNDADQWLFACGYYI